MQMYPKMDQASMQFNTMTSSRGMVHPLAEAVIAGAIGHGWFIEYQVCRYLDDFGLLIGCCATQPVEDDIPAG